MRKRFTGLRASGRMRPRMNSSISTGTRVTESSAAPAMAKVLVHASGANRRPSCASSVNTGRKETVMMSSEKNSAGPTSLQAAIIASVRDSPAFKRSRCLCAFSIMTMAASIMAPMAMAMPPRLIRLEFMPSARMAMKAISTPTGSMRMATRALLTCSRKTMQTSATMSASSASVRFRVSMARWIRSARS
ncbi:hypothetical protein MASR1M97_25260 [Candidatus Desulfobacillus denitrificans]